MRDKERRLAWIEGLIGTQSNLAPRSNVMTISSDRGPLALSFESIEEVIPGSHLQSFAFLPPWFCGTAVRGADLYPIVDLGGNREARASIALVRHEECLCGFRFFGSPQVVDLDKASSLTDLTEDEGRLPFPLVASKRFEGPEGPSLLLDMPAILRALCDA